MLLKLLTFLVIYSSICQLNLKSYVSGDDNYSCFLDIMAILFIFNVLIMLVIGQLKPRNVAY